MELDEEEEEYARQDEEDRKTLDMLKREYEIRKDMHKKIEKTSLPEAIGAVEVSGGEEVNQKLLDLCNDFREYLDALNFSQELNEKLTARSISLTKGVVEENREVITEVERVFDKIIDAHQISDLRQELNELDAAKWRLYKLEEGIQDMMKARDSSNIKKNDMSKGEGI